MTRLGDDQRRIGDLLTSRQIEAVPNEFLRRVAGAALFEAAACRTDAGGLKITIVDRFFVTLRRGAIAGQAVTTYYQIRCARDPLLIVQHAPELCREIGVGERLEDDLEAWIEPPMMHDGIPGISGGVEHLELWLPP